jgi:hypothetical protein
MLKWTQLLYKAKGSWLIIDLEWISEQEIAAERLSYSEDKSLSFQDLYLVS